MTRTTRPLALAVAGVLALTLGACGGGTSSDADAVASATKIVVPPLSSVDGGSKHTIGKITYQLPAGYDVAESSPGDGATLHTITRTGEATPAVTVSVEERSTSDHDLQGLIVMTRLRYLDPADTTRDIAVVPDVEWSSVEGAAAFYGSGTSTSTDGTTSLREFAAVAGRDKSSTTRVLVSLNSDAGKLTESAGFTVLRTLRID